VDLKKKHNNGKREKVPSASKKTICPNEKDVKRTLGKRSRSGEIG